MSCLFTHGSLWHEELEWTQVDQKDVLQVAGEATMKTEDTVTQPRCGCLSVEPGRVIEESC